jgi:hypothetical protein
MKKYIILSLFIALCSVSCTDFLDVKPEEKPSEGTFFTTDKDATEALNECYWLLREIGNRTFYWEWTAGGDDLTYGRTRSDEYHRMTNFNYTGREGPLNSATEVMTRYMARCNWVIYALLRKGNLTPVESNRLGEAYFLRAFCHFYVAYRHGRPDNGVPFDRYEDYDPYEYGIPEQRATVMDNYALIIEDLQNAEPLVPFFEAYGADDLGRVHKAAVWAYMVKVYAYWAQYEASKWALIPPLVDKMETEGKRGLLDKFEDVFLMANNWSKEYVWAINSSGEFDTGSNMPGMFPDNKGWGAYNNYGYFKPTLGLFNEYREGDRRRRATMLEYNDEFQWFGTTRRYWSTADEPSGFMICKYLEPFTYGQIFDDGHGESPYVNKGTDGLSTDLNFHWFRHAEAVLFKAEALIKTGNGTEAAAQLNRLTRRAGLGDVYTNATMADLKHERRCELAAEPSDRFKDLKRWEDWDALNAPKMGRIYADRADPLSTWVAGETWPARTFNRETDIAYPYNPDDVTKADGKLKQNPMD